MDMVNELLSTTDAQVWARYFMQVIDGGGVEVDEGLMLSWFANAIETGRSQGRKELCPHDFIDLADDLSICRDCGTVR